MIPIGTDYRMHCRPWVNYALVAANVAIFLLGYHGGTEAGLARTQGLLLHPDAPRLHQFFSSVFLHGGWGHLLGNMVFLWVFGNAINDRLGHGGYLAFYLGGGVLAGVGYVLLAGTAPVLGASGAISAVTGAYLVLLPRVRVTVLFWFLYLLMPIELSSLIFLLFQFGWNLWMSLDASLTGTAAGGVAYAAHSSGYVYGIAVAAILLATRVLPRDEYDLLRLLQQSRRRSAYRRMVARGFDPFGVGRAGQGPPPPPSSKRIQARAVESAPSDSATAREIELRRGIAGACTRHNMTEATALYLQLVQIADNAVLSQSNQLDVANQLMAEEQYAAAADAYERLLKHYPALEHAGDIHLMLGIAYGRYLHQPKAARPHLQEAVERLRDENKRHLAQSDLEALGG